MAVTIKVQTELITERLPRLKAAMEATDALEEGDLEVLQRLYERGEELVAAPSPTTADVGTWFAHHTILARVSRLGISDRAWLGRSDRADRTRRNGLIPSEKNRRSARQT
jgi:hypothetical protein